MRRLVAVLGVLLLVPTQAGASPTDIHSAAREVRNAIPAVEAYAADHNGYAGMTLAKLRKYDRSVRRIAVRRATKNRYCIESTSRGPIVHYDGPGGPMRRGRCGVRGAVYVAPPPPQTPQRLLLRAELSVDMYQYRHGGSYAGMTLEELRKIDYSLTGVAVKWATPEAYCIETEAAPTYYLRGPGGKPAAGSCPAAPF